MSADLDALEALERAATAGPWAASPNWGDEWIVGLTADGEWDGQPGICQFDELDDRRPANNALIVALRNAAPALLAELREARAVLKAVEWGGHTYQGHEPCCPVCRYERDDHGDHAPDCRLGALVAGVG